MATWYITSGKVVEEKLTFLFNETIVMSFEDLIEPDKIKDKFCATENLLLNNLMYKHDLVKRIE